MKQKNIILIGFMGCGKTTLGRKLANCLGLRFLDTDRYIEHKEGMSIAEIFEQKGEAYFRQLEEDVCRMIAKKYNYVIATGGGMIKNPSNMLLLRKNGRIVYLKATPERIFRNVGKDKNRPLLQGGDRMEKIKSLMKERVSSYEKYADITIDVSKGTIHAIIDSLCIALGVRKMKICVIHGPNINFTGIREKAIYGAKTLEAINEAILEEAKKYHFQTELFQSNYEGAIIDKLQQCYFDKVDGVIINPGAYTHYSYAIRDAIASTHIPTIEVHMSNIHTREEFRHTSVTVPVCIGQMCGFGPQGYLLALHAMKFYLEKEQK